MTKLNSSDVLMCYDGSLEGYFTVVFEAYAFHIIPESIQEASSAQPRLGQEVIEVSCDLTKAERVRVGLCNKAGFQSYQRVKRAFLSGVSGRESALFSYIASAMEGGRKAISDPTRDEVAAVERLALKVDNECEKMRQFVRFEKLGNGVFLSTVNPTGNVVPLIMNHFIERFNTQPFVIYDEVHHLAGVYDCQSSKLVRVDGLNVPSRTNEEESYQALWKLFYDSVSNEQRYNTALRTSHMPKKYWRNLTEMRQAAAR